MTLIALLNACGQPNATVDDTPLTIVSSAPTSGATGVNLSADLTLGFSEPMAVAAVDLTPTTDLGAASWDSSRQRATFTKPTRFVAGTRYTMRVTGTGLSGKKFTSSIPVIFTTTPPPTPPAPPPVTTPPTPPVTPPVTPPPPVSPPVTPPVTPPPTPPVTPPPTPPVTPPVTPPSGIKLPPVGKIAWDWQIGASTIFNITVPTGVKLLDIDGFNASASKVAELKQQGIYTVCYLDVGSYEPGRPDSSQYPSYLKIQQDPDWPAEYFLDVTDVFKPNSVLAAILSNRFKMCKDKGFDAIEPDNLQNDENVSGGKITKQQQIDFNGWVADTAHKYGLAVFQKNGPDNVLLKDRTGKMMVEKFDGILNEQCQEYDECAALAEYPKRGKLALNVEYKAGITLDCALSNSLQINSIKKDLGLAGGTMSGYKLEFCK